MLEHRGTGESAVPQDPETYRIDRMVADVEALRVHLGLEQLDILAHSAGANLAMLYAIAHPGPCQPPDADHPGHAGGRLPAVAWSRPRRAPHPRRASPGSRLRGKPSSASKKTTSPRKTWDGDHPRLLRRLDPRRPSPRGAPPRRDEEKQETCTSPRASSTRGHDRRAGHPRAPDPDPRRAPATRAPPRSAPGNWRTCSSRRTCASRYSPAPATSRGSTTRRRSAQW